MLSAQAVYLTVSTFSTISTTLNTSSTFNYLFFTLYESL